MSLPPAVHGELLPLGMYLSAGSVVQAIMLGLVAASVIAWTVCLAKAWELLVERRRQRRELALLRQAVCFDDAWQLLGHRQGPVGELLREVWDELDRTAGLPDPAGLTERIRLRLERCTAASAQDIRQGIGLLASIGSTAPFLGLMGTVWGIMNSFIGIAESQTTNLAVVAPGIAEALLATALGLLAAIPAVVIYNALVRGTAHYNARTQELSLQVLLLINRELEAQREATRWQFDEGGTDVDVEREPAQEVGAN